MDINCTSDCQFQIDGKCTLAEVPPALVSSTADIADSENTDGGCPYYYAREEK